MERQATLSTLPLGDGTYLHWEVVYGRDGKDILEVDIDGRSGRVLETWTGDQVAWSRARGYPGTLGRSLNQPLVWAVLCLAFLLPFVDWRRPRRLLHLDLIVLLSFTVSEFFFLRANIGVAMWLALPPLVYLVCRTALLAFRIPRRPLKHALTPVVGRNALIALLIAVTALRVAFTLIDSEPIDVTLASLVGADRIAHGQQLYVDNDVHGDTYGPLAYLAYVPFERIWPVGGGSSALEAARAATVTFDLLTILGLFLLGRRLRRGESGTMLGLALAFGWAAYPFTWHVLANATNDGLVALALVGVLLALSSPVARGAALAVATMTKFSPALLLPIVARARGSGRATSVAVATFAVLAVLLIVPFVPDGGLTELWNTTVGYQISRDSPFSVWEQGGPTAIRMLLEAGLATFVVLLGSRPRRPSVTHIAAACAACIAWLELLSRYWSYAYLAWLVPPLLVALFADAVFMEAPDPELTTARQAPS